METTVLSSFLVLFYNIHHLSSSNFPIAFSLFDKKGKKYRRTKYSTRNTFVKQRIYIYLSRIKTNIIIDNSLTISFGSSLPLLEAASIDLFRVQWIPPCPRFDRDKSIRLERGAWRAKITSRR